MVDAKQPEYTWYGEPPDALPSGFISRSDKFTHQPLIYLSSKVKHCKTHSLSQQYPTHYSQKKREEKQQFQQENSEGLNLCGTKFGERETV